MYFLDPICTSEWEDTSQPKFFSGRPEFAVDMNCLPARDSNQAWDLVKMGRYIHSHGTLR